VYVLLHNLLTSGDGSASLKWGSTNAYAEDAAGKPVYDWKIVDRIFDVFRQKGVTPLVEVGFTPGALSIQPQPYRHDFPKGSVSPDGRIRPETAQSGKNSFTSSRSTCGSGTATRK